MTNKIKLGTSIVTIGAHMFWERISGMRPKSPPAIPPSYEKLTTQWLTGALCAKHPGAIVKSFDLEGGSVGTTSRMQIKLNYNEQGRQAKLPERVFAKAAPLFTSRMAAGLTEATHKEVRFLTTLRQELDIEAPVAYFGGFEVPSQRSIVLLKVMDDHVFTNPTIYINQNEAQDMMGILAALHAKFWNSPRLSSELSWAHKSYDYMVMLNDFGFEARCHVGINRSASVIPEAILARRAEIYPATMRSLLMNNLGAQTLLHHDVHIGNWYKTPEGRMGLGDWQCVVQGGFSCDLSYAISSALTVDDRRAWEKHLITIYLEKLRQGGVVDVPSFDEAWLRYRQQFFHALVFWLFTIGAGSLQPNMQPDEFSLRNIERFTNAINDLESLAALNE